MIAASGLRWILTLAFAALTAYGMWRAVCVPRWQEKVSHLLHAVMAVAMAVMTWPRGMELPAGPQIAFFAAAALWYPAAASLPSSASVLASRHGAGRARESLGAVPHAAAMAAMAWMLHAMDRAMDGMAGMAGTHAAAASGGGHEHHGGGGADALATMSLTATDARATAGVLAAFFLACALWWLARGFDGARAPGIPATAGEPAIAGTPATAHTSGTAVRHHAYDLLCHGAMALGMAVMFALMV